MNLEDGVELAAFFGREDIVAKFQAIQTLEDQSPYQYVSASTRYWQRARRALTNLPAAFHEAALAIFANVLYIGDDLLTETLRHLAREVADWVRDLNYSVPNDVHVFTVDHPGLVDDFFQVGAKYGWTGRLDNIPQRSIRGVSEFLHRLEEAPTAQPPDRQLLEAVLSRPIWRLRQI